MHEKKGWVKYDVEVDNCDNAQADGEGREEGEENIIKTETRGLKENNHENMKCRQKWGDWFTQS